MCENKNEGGRGERALKTNVQLVHSLLGLLLLDMHKQKWEVNMEFLIRVTY